MSENQKGRCRSCGIDLINWSRIHQRRIEDANVTFQSLKYEWIRHYFWHVPIDQRVAKHARRKGRVVLGTHVEKRIRQSVGGRSAWDGRQTPMQGQKVNIIHYGQHAVACCCRVCMEYWHGIPVESPLTEEQIAYFSKLVLLYIDERMPWLKAEPERAPFLRGGS